MYNNATILIIFHFSSRFRLAEKRKNAKNQQTQKDSFNRMYNIKSKDEIRKDILHVNSVEGRIENLNKSIQGISKNKNF